MNKELKISFAWAGVIVVGALGASLARQNGLIGGETVDRLVMGLTGLMVAAMGNRMPKAIAPSECARQVARVGGWSLALSGLVYAALWAFAPVELAVIGGCAAIGTGMAITLGYTLSLRRRIKAS